MGKTPHQPKSVANTCVHVFPLWGSTQARMCHCQYYYYCLFGIILIGMDRSSCVYHIQWFLQGYYPIFPKPCNKQYQHSLWELLKSCHWQWFQIHKMPMTTTLHRWIFGLFLSIDEWHSSPCDHHTRLSIRIIIVTWVPWCLLHYSATWVCKHLHTLKWMGPMH